MVTVVWVTTTFVGFHRWQNAPDKVAFLRDFHRHVFHVKVAVRVVGDDREVEFFLLKDQVNDYLYVHYEGRQFTESCEQIAKRVLNAIPNAAWVEVSEDGENGALVIGDAS